MTAPAAFFAQLLEAADEAERAAGGVSERWYDIAGRRLRLRLIGPAIEPIVAPALGHLQTPAGDRQAADLTLQAWDCASLGLAFPKAPVGVDAFTPRGDVTPLTDQRFKVAYDLHGRQLSAMDVAGRTAVYCVGDVGQVPNYQAGEPVRSILSWFMREHGRQLIHAGAVGTAQGGVLVLGRGGAGKSNTCLGTLASDLSFASDDFTAVSVEGEPWAYSLYSTGKTLESDWRRHPFLADLPALRDPAGRGKAVYFLHQGAPQKLIRAFPIRAILNVRRGGETCCLTPASPASALTTCVPETAVILPDVGAELLRTLSRLVRSTPCYDLWLGPDPKQIPGVIAGLLATLNASALAPA